MREVKKVLIVTNVPQDYRIALFNKLNEMLLALNIQLMVVFAAKGYKRRKAKLDFSKMTFPHHFLESAKFSFGSSENTMFSYPGLIRYHRKYKPDITFVIGYSPATIKLWLYSFIAKVNYFIWSGSIVFKGRKDSTLRKWLRKILIKRSTGFIAYGTKAKEYLVTMGAPAEKVFIAINTVDTQFFAQIAHQRNGRTPNEIKNLLYLGYLTHGKQIDKLIKTIAELKKLDSKFYLRIVGDGPAKETLMQLVDQLNLSNHLSFEGFRQKSELPEYFVNADCFLFQTGCDIWGLVLNEAMASGLPCLVSPNAGASNDLIIQNETGIIIDFSQHQQAAKAIHRIIHDDPLLLKLGNNAASLIENKVKPANSAQGFINAINFFKNHD